MFCSNSIDARLQSANYDLIYEGLSEGNTFDIYDHLSDIVYIQFDGKQAAYSKKQAKAALDKFFRYNKPYDFDLLFDRYKKETALKYSIGRLKTNKGSYKVYLLMKVTSNNYLIQQIRLEKM